MKQENRQLRERISKARTPEQIAELLLEGDSYTEATGSTRRKWQKAAKRRIKEMEDGE